MEALPSSIRGLINDLTRTLTGSMVHMDNLLLHLDYDSGECEDAWLANYQLERALEFFIELRSEYMIPQGSSNKQAKSYKLTAVKNLFNNLRNLLEVVAGYFDMIKINSVDVWRIVQITDNICKSIQDSHYALNAIIWLPESIILSNRFKLSHKNVMQEDNSILFLKDDENVNILRRIVLCKHNYTGNWC